MTIQEKISRYQLIPKLIANLEENRARILNGKAVCYDKNDSSAGTPGNTAESSMLSYACKGEKQKELSEERARLTQEIQSEIDEMFCNEEAETIDTARIIKLYFINGISVKKIAHNYIFRDYKTVLRMFHNGCEKLNIPHKTTQYHLQERCGGERAA